jgi:hypothetical protein
MELWHGDEVIENPTAADVHRVFEVARAEGFGLSLEDSGWALSATALADGTWDMYFSVGADTVAECENMPSEALRGLYLARLEGEAAFRARLGAEGIAITEPKPPPPPMTRAQRGLPPVWLFPAFIFGAGVWIAGPGALKLWTWPRVTLPAIPLPAAIDSEAARVVGGFFLVALCLVLVVVAIVLVRFKRTQAWPAVRGRIVESRRGEESYRDLTNQTTRMRTVPVVRYVYAVDGVQYRGHKIDAGEGVGEDEIDGILAHYPVGAEVAVFHDPKDPSKAVLERKIPKDVARGCVSGLGIALVFLVALMWLLTNGPGALRAALPNANLPVLLVAGIAGLVLLGASFAIVRRSEEARGWPRVPGRIAARGIRTRSSTPLRPSRDVRTTYYPWVRYDFTVDGRQRVGTTLKHGIEVGGSRGYAEKVLARYPVGAVVQVSYDPANTSRSAIEHGSGIAWILPLLGGAALAIAVFASGVFG